MRPLHLLAILRPAQRSRAGGLRASTRKTSSVRSVRNPFSRFEPYFEPYDDYESAIWSLPHDDGDESMNRRAGRQKRSQKRESQSAQGSRLSRKLSWATGIAAILVAVVVGGIFYAVSQSGSEQGQLASSASPQVGVDVGDLVPEFDLRLVDGSMVTSTTLASANKPAFYFFFATW